MLLAQRADGATEAPNGEKPCLGGRAVQLPGTDAETESDTPKFRAQVLWASVSSPVKQRRQSLPLGLIEKAQ